MISILPLGFDAEVTPETDLPALLADLMRAHLDAGDVVVVTSKIVSKWLGLYAPADVERPDLVLQQSRSVVAERSTESGVTRVVHATAGPVMAGAGIDASNSADERLLLLPDDPDAVARRLRHQIAQLLSRPTDFGILLSDTSGRAWRGGLTDFALGAAGVHPVDDLRGLADTAGRDLAVTVRNVADEIASAADLVKGKIDRVPVALVSGMRIAATTEDGPGVAGLVRTGPTDWFGLGRAEAVRSALGVTPGTPLAAEVGIESVAPEPLVDRVARAVRVALTAGDDVTAEQETRSTGAVTVTLTSADPVALGRVWARLEIALAGERLTVDARRGVDAVELVVSSTGSAQ